MRRRKAVKLAVGALVWWSSLASSFAQGLVVDQASGPDQLTSQATLIPDNPIAQSFTPSLSAVGYLQLQAFIFATSSGQTLVINLRQGAFNGAIVSSTTPVVLVNRGSEVVTFYFPANVSVIPEQLYYFEPVVLSSGRMLIGDEAPSTYSRGDYYANGVPSGGAVDFWFREGVVVPEPETFWMLVLGGCLFLWHRRVVQFRGQLR
jgi:hypothetical protein